MSTLDEARNAIAQRAFEAVGTPFRLFGRASGHALDCVGLALTAVGEKSRTRIRPQAYSLKGQHIEKLRVALRCSDFEEVNVVVQPRVGDIVFVAPGPLQGHLMVCVKDGWVHADCGLGRVVFRPGPLPWEAICAWRLSRI